LQTFQKSKLLAPVCRSQFKDSCCYFNQAPKY